MFWKIVYLYHFLKFNRLTGYLVIWIKSFEKIENIFFKPLRD
jgi:hypothetical protein